uniref:Col_cuticle_N domain-containing protein n=1 Tax=Caenorhabditis tropicalis TaxID=1561998 RepID=A0A1I7V399_9PELO
MWDVVRKKSLRSKAFIGVVVMFAMSFSGIAVVNGFAFEIFMDTGLTVLEASIANDVIALVSLVEEAMKALPRFPFCGKEQKISKITVSEESTRF